MNSAPDIFENCYPDLDCDRQSGGAVAWVVIAVIVWAVVISFIISMAGCTAPHSVQFAPLVQFNDSPVTLPLIKGETNDVSVVQ